MNSKIINLIIALIVILAFIGAAIGISVMISNSKKEETSKISIETTQEALDFIDEIYKGLEGKLPDLQSREVNLEQEFDFRRTTGLTSNENVEFAVVSEPLMNAQAYSLVIVKTKDGANANEIAKQMSEQIDTRKWICVSAEKLYATSDNNIAFLVMASKEWAKPVYDSFKKLSGTTEQEYQKTEQELIDEEWPDEM